MCLYDTNAVRLNAALTDVKIKRRTEESLSSESDTTFPEFNINGEVRLARTRHCSAPIC